MKLQDVFTNENAQDSAAHIATIHSYETGFPCSIVLDEHGQLGKALPRSEARYMLEYENEMYPFSLCEEPKFLCKIDGLDELDKRWLKETLKFIKTNIKVFFQHWYGKLTTAEVSAKLVEIAVNSNMKDANVHGRQGAFWILGQSVEFILEGQFEIIGIAVPYGAPQFNLNYFSHAKYWPAYANELGNEPFYYLPQGIVKLQSDGVAQIHLPKRFCIASILDAIKKKYNLENVEIKICPNNKEFILREQADFDLENRSYELGRICNDRLEFVSSRAFWDMDQTICVFLRDMLRQFADKCVLGYPVQIQQVGDVADEITGATEKEAGVLRTRWKQLLYEIADKFDYYIQHDGPNGDDDAAAKLREGFDLLSQWLPCMWM